MSFGTPTRFQLWARDRGRQPWKWRHGSAGDRDVGPGSLRVHCEVQRDRWSTVSLSSASGGLACTARAQHGATVEFKTSARAIAVVGRRGSLNGRAKVYVDGVYRSTISLRKSRLAVQGRGVQHVMDQHGDPLGQAGRDRRAPGRVEVDAFVILR